MSIVRRLLGETVIYSLTPLLASLVGLLLVPIYTRTFSPSEYGALAQVNTTTTLATIFVVFGLDNSSAVWFWDHPEPYERSRTFSTWLAFTLSTSAIIAGAAILLRSVLARWLLRDESLSSVWLVFAANLVALNVPRIAILWFRMQRAPWPAVAMGGITSVATAVFGIVFVVRMRLGLAGVIGGQAMGSWLGTLVAAFALRHVFSARAVDTARLPPMLRLSAPLVLMTNLNWLMGGAVAYFVNFLCSREVAGLYQVAASLSAVLGLAMFAFDQAWAPFALSIRDAAVAKRVYGVVVELTFVVGLLLAFGVTAFARPVLVLVTHPQYVSAQWVLAILSLNIVLVNIPSVLSVTFARERVTMPLAKATAAGAAVTVVILPLAAKWLGKEGAAGAVLIGTIVIVATAFRASQRIFPIELRPARILAAAGCCTVCVLILFASMPLVFGTATMIAHRAALTLVLAGALGIVYRAPLRDAWRAGRAAGSPVDDPA